MFVKTQSFPYHHGPAGDAHSAVQVGGQEDEEEQGEEEGRAADELEEVEHPAVQAAGQHLFQHEGQEGQQLEAESPHINIIIVMASAHLFCDVAHVLCGLSSLSKTPGPYLLAHDVYSNSPSHKSVRLKSTMYQPDYYQSM